MHEYTRVQMSTHEYTQAYIAKYTQEYMSIHEYKSNLQKFVFVMNTFLCESATSVLHSAPCHIKEYASLVDSRVLHPAKGEM